MGNRLFSNTQDKILELVLSGCTQQKDLAKELDKDLSYVKYHLSFMYKKTGVKNMEGLILWAWRNGYFLPEQEYKE